MVAFWRSADSFAAGERYEGTMRVTINPYTYDGSDPVKPLLDSIANPPKTEQNTQPSDVKPD
jgi:hypothetical protein